MRARQFVEDGPRAMHARNSDWFARVANATAAWTGKPIAFLLAVGVVLVWAISGPLFHFSDTWQLVINTGTTIVTFLMVFLIQNTQNRDTLALQIKLSELIVAVQAADDDLAAIEDASDEELKAAHDKIVAQAKAAIHKHSRE